MDTTILHWNYRNLYEIPEDLLRYDEILRQIYLKENFIKVIPQWLFQLTHLKFIHLAGNCIKILPDEIYYLKNLEFLDLSNNRLKRLPETIGQLSKLQRFHVSGNQLTNIPKTIGCLKNLEELDLSANNIHAIPVEIGGCVKLNEVILHDNLNLKFLPEKLTALFGLTTIWADRCGFLYLPVLLSPSIKNLRMFNNGFVMHIPMSYENFISSYYEICSCCITPRRWSSSTRHFTIKEKFADTSLVLPFATRVVHRINTEEVFSLFDICLREINKFGIKTYENLPKLINNFIENGPLGKCTLMECGMLLYTEYYLLITKRCHSNSKLCFSCYFCSNSCANAWISQKNSKYYCIDWEYEA